MLLVERDIRGSWLTLAICSIFATEAVAITTSARNVVDVVELQSINGVAIDPIQSPYIKRDESFGGYVNMDFKWALIFPFPVHVDDVSARLLEHLELSGETDRFLEASSQLVAMTSDLIEHDIPEFARGFGSGGDFSQTLDTGPLTVAIDLDDVVKLEARQSIHGYANSGPGAGHTVGQIISEGFAATVTVPEPSAYLLITCGVGAGVRLIRLRPSRCRAASCVAN